MSSIHYKFKSTLQFKTLTFNGLHISVPELKRVIYEKEHIRTEAFDLIVTNAHTKRQYNPEELVSRNSSVIIQRIPKDNAPKLPKIQNTGSSGIVTRMANLTGKPLGHIQAEAFARMTEEERLAHIKEISYNKYQPANYQKRTLVVTGPPPLTYVCNRCNQTGHWNKECPMLTVKHATGILAEQLMPTTSDDPLAMLHRSGKFVKPIMHYEARLKRKRESDDLPAYFEDSELVPPALSCPICGHLLSEAMLTICCGESFCAECIQRVLLEGHDRLCPGSNCGSKISVDSLVPNKNLRQLVERIIFSREERKRRMQKERDDSIRTGRVLSSG